MDTQSLELAQDNASDATQCGALAPTDMLDLAQAASAFLKALAHEGRLMILCHLSTG